MARMAERGSRSTTSAVFVLAFCAALAGCSKKPNIGTVTGDVTFDGRPLSSGVIHFEAADGKAAPVDAAISDGKYAIEMPPGDKRISISAPKVTGKRKAYDLPDSPMVDIVQELLPVQYNAQSDLTLIVVAGPQIKNYDLKSGK